MPGNSLRGVEILRDYIVDVNKALSVRTALCCIAKTPSTLTSGNSQSITFRELQQQTTVSPVTICDDADLLREINKGHALDSELGEVNRPGSAHPP